METVSHAFSDARKIIAEKAPVLDRILTWKAEGAEELSSAGFCDRERIMEYNDELIHPFKFMPPEDGDMRGYLEVSFACCAPLCTTLQPFRPTSAASRKTTFVMWNVTCFWLGFLDLILMFWLRTEPGVWSISIAILDGLLGYFFAYFFFFTFISTSNVVWMCRGLVVIGLYVIGTAFLTYEAFAAPESHVVVIEGLVNGLKALANCVVFFHAVRIMNATRKGASSRASGSAAMV